MQEAAQAAGPEGLAGLGIAEVRVSSWADLNEALYAESFNERLGRFRSTWVFRGLTHATYDPGTSLSRLADRHGSVEQHLLRDFRKYARRDASPGDSVWNWLAVAQHHGLPTRLLDWTYSPFVALHFATADLAFADPDRLDDAAVWCVDYRRAHAYLPPRLRDELRAEGVGVFTAEILERVAATLGDLDRLAPDPFVVFLEPPSLDERIVNQFALFSLLSSPAAQLHQWLVDKPDVARRLVIPVELLWEVRDKLDQANVTERVLMPGLDGLSRWLRRYYTPR